MSARTRWLLAAAIVCGAILVGGVADRVFVAQPAWRQLGAAAWANYSRRADLGPGLIAYPLEGVGAALLTLAAAVSHRLDGPLRQRGRAALYLSAAGYLAGLLLTLKAAPIMLALGDSALRTDLARAFADFYFWGLYLRGGVDGAALLCGIWAMARTPKPCLTTKVGPD
jgi:hypothetical protein